MKTLTKTIGKPGKFLANATDGSGKRVPAELTADRLKAWADKANRMHSKGLRIPGPYLKHYKSATPASKLPTPPASLDELHEKLSGGIYRNFGNWKNFQVDEQGNLVADFSVPDHLEEEAKGLHVSPMVLKEFEDGDGEKWQDCLTHVCLTDRPVIYDQDDFKTASPENTEALAAGFSIDCSFSDLTFSNGESDTGNVETNNKANSGSPIVAKISQLRELLEKKKGIKLPGSSEDPLEVLDQLIGVLTADTSAEDASAGSPEPVAMGFSQDDLSKPHIQNLINARTGDLKRQYKDRVLALVPGTVSLSQANEKLIPQIESFQLSLDESGNAQPSKLDTMIESLELVSESRNLTNQLVTGEAYGFSEDGTITTQPLPDEYQGETGNYSEKDIEDGVDAQLKAAGLR